MENIVCAKWLILFSSVKVVKDCRNQIVGSKYVEISLLRYYTVILPIMVN